jgi:hypothetical protein
MEMQCLCDHSASYTTVQNRNCSFFVKPRKGAQERPNTCAHTHKRRHQRIHEIKRGASPTLSLGFNSGCKWRYSCDINTEDSGRTHTFARLLAHGFVFPRHYAGLQAIFHPDSGAYSGKLPDAAMSGGELTLVGTLDCFPFALVDDTIVLPSNADSQACSRAVIMTHA